MTQAYNLAILANAVDTSGKLNVGTNATGTLPLANGGTGTTNTVNSIVAGTGITTSVSGTAVTINASGSGTVTSVATGNGLSGGTITTTGTLTVACPTYNSVGSYALYSKLYNGANVGPNAGQDMSTVGAAGIRWAGVAACSCPTNQGFGAFINYDNLSGTWRNMGGRAKSESGNNNNYIYAGGVACRVA